MRGPIRSRSSSTVLGAAINVDFVSLTPFSGALYEGEKATLAGGAIVNADHPKYSGSGFLDFFHTDGASATFNVVAASAGAQKLVVRYASGQGNPVPGMQLYVNGVLSPMPPFAPTGSWRVWADSDSVPRHARGREQHAQIRQYDGPVHEHRLYHPDTELHGSVCARFADGEHHTALGYVADFGRKRGLYRDDHQPRQ